MTAAEAAAALGISADAVRWHLRRGQLAGRRRERGWQVDAASVMTRRRDGAAA
jgi:DNA-directed RNA polymerase specialized sigma24 family protein